MRMVLCAYGADGGGRAAAAQGAQHPLRVRIYIYIPYLELHIDNYITYRMRMVLMNIGLMELMGGGERLRLKPPSIRCEYVSIYIYM